MLHKLEAYKYPLLILLLGVLLLLLPGGIRSPTAGAEAEARDDFSALICRAEGVGDCAAALTEHGAVIICEGAEDPQVRLSLLQAVRSYTGLTSDRITILKMAGKG
jgi:hypothetical protein